MKAVVIFQKGSPTESIQVQDSVAQPTLQAGEVLIKVVAASINPIDWKLIPGVPGMDHGGFMGKDVSGVIEQVADDVTTFQVGDPVYANAPTGSFAEYVKAPAAIVRAKPENLDFAEAASLPLAGLTAWRSLTVIGQLQAGQKVLISGGTGGVGSLALQMAKAIGAQEIWSTGSAVDKITEYGATKVVNYKEENVFEALKGQEFDVIFDTIGDSSIWKAASTAGALKKGGKYVSIAVEGDNTLAFFGSVIARKFSNAIGFGPPYEMFVNNITDPKYGTYFHEMSDLIQEGKVKPVLDGREFSLTTESVKEMIEASMSHRAKGKLILKVADP